MRNRVCRVCKTEYPCSSKHFYRHKNRAKGLQYECKACAVYLATKALRKRNIERKQFLVDHMGGKCQHCGGTFHPHLYDFHHIDPTKKEMDSLSQRKLSDALQELTKCLLLCAHCHKMLHFNQQEELNREREEQFLARISLSQTRALP